MKVYSIKIRHSLVVCKALAENAGSAYIPQTKEYQLAAHIKHRYKLTISEYLAMLAGGCEICGTMEGLCIDHDHRCCSNVGGPTCGKCIRGVLCHKHNRGEAAFISIEEIDALLVYRLKFEPTKGM